MSAYGIVQSQLSLLQQQIVNDAFPNSQGVYANMSGNIIEIYNVQQSDLVNLQLYTSPIFSSTQVTFTVNGINVQLQNQNGQFITNEFIIPGFLEQVQNLADKNLTNARITANDQGQGAPIIYNPFTPINNVSVPDMSDNLTNPSLFVPVTTSTSGLFKYFDITFVYVD
jgi:hypothetical protein